MKALKIISVILTTVILLTLTCTLVFAEGDEENVNEEVVLTTGVEDVEEPEAEGAANGEDSVKSVKAIAAAAIVGVVAAAGAFSMAIAVKKSVDGTSRQPEAGGDIRTSMMMGLVFIETAIIYALIVAILIIFVL